MELAPSAPARRVASTWLGADGDPDRLGSGASWYPIVDENLGSDLSALRVQSKAFGYTPTGATQKCTTGPFKIHSRA